MAKALSNINKIVLFREKLIDSANRLIIVMNRKDAQMITTEEKNKLIY